MASIGHNRPPAYDAEALAASEAAAQVHLDHAVEWRKVEKIADAAQAGRAVDFITGARAARALIDAERKEQKAPHDAAGRAVQDVYNPILNAMLREIDAVKAKVDAWNKEEAQRQAAQQQVEAEAARAEREQAAAAAEAAEMRGDLVAAQRAQQAAEAAADAEARAARPVNATIKSATGQGRTMAMRTVREAEVTDLGAAFLALRDDPRIAEVVRKIANERIRAAKGAPVNIPGIKVNERKVTV